MDVRKEARARKIDIVPAGGLQCLVEMKRIDIYTIDIGGGHIAPAVALKEQFDILGYKDLDVRVVNLGIALGASFLRYLYKFYWNNALRYPPLINAFYRGADNPFMIKIVDRILGITILPKFVRYLERERPDLVVSTYFTFTHYLELLKQVGQLMRCPWCSIPSRSTRTTSGSLPSSTGAWCSPANRVTRSSKRESGLAR